MSASGIVEAEVFRSEQVSRLARTSDPASPTKGDAWIRTDIQPTTNSVAALRVQGDSGYLEAPLFDPTATLGQDVYVGQRFVFSDGSEAHLLVTDQGGAVGSPRVVTSSGTEYEAHDDVEVSAIPDTLVDNFEEPLYEDQSKSLSDYYAGDLANYTRQQNTVMEGDYALERNSSDSDFIVSTSGLNYPEPGDVWRYWLQQNGDQNHTHYFGVQDSGSTDNAYDVTVHWNDQEIRLRKRSGGSNTSLDTTGQTITNGNWYEVEIMWETDGTITATLYDDSGSELASVIGSDTDYTDGGIGWSSSGPGSGVVYTDNLRVVGSV
ncbi:hypothetical protein DVK02_14985 [Halobellus sp. Atlit-31R]|nr:hypothetical protein DVK02_14985 [Halobellus sp. Atlit-31R]